MQKTTTTVEAGIFIVVAGDAVFRPGFGAEELRPGIPASATAGSSGVATD